MKKIVLLLGLCLSIHLLFAQVTDFKLSDYKYRTPGYRLMAVQFNSVGGLSASKSLSYTGSEVKNGAQNFDLAGQLGLQQVYNTDARQHSSFFLPGFDIGLNRDKQDNIKITGGTIVLKAYYNQMDTWYKPNYFLELGGEANLETAHNKSKDDSKKTINKSSAAKPRISITGGIGQGRLENVQDAQMALFILEDLYKQKIIPNKMSKENTYKFAQLITDIRSKRILDYRIRHIYELTRIDSFFKANRFVSDCNIKYFTSINDNWSFALQGWSDQFETLNEIRPDGFIYQGSRNAGSIRYIRLRAAINNEYHSGYLKDSVSETKMKAHDNRPSVDLIVGIEKDVPVNLYWQRNMGANFDLSYFKDTHYSALPATPLMENKVYTFTGFYNWGYYPNSRTAVTLGTTAVVYYASNKTGRLIYNYNTQTYSVISSVGKGWNASATARLSGTYFVNYNTQLSGYVNLLLTPYVKSKSYPNAPSGSIAFGITYVHIFY